MHQEERQKTILQRGKVAKLFMWSDRCRLLLLPGSGSICPELAAWACKGSEALTDCRLGCFARWIKARNEIESFAVDQYQRALLRQLIDLRTVQMGATIFTGLVLLD